MLGDVVWRLDLVTVRDSKVAISHQNNFWNDFKLIHDQFCYANIIPAAYSNTLLEYTAS